MSMFEKFREYLTKPSVASIIGALAVGMAANTASASDLEMRISSNYSLHNNQVISEIDGTVPLTTEQDGDNWKVIDEINFDIDFTHYLDQGVEPSEEVTYNVNIAHEMWSLGSDGHGPFIDGLFGVQNGYFGNQDETNGYWGAAAIVPINNNLIARGEVGFTFDHPIRPAFYSEGLIAYTDSLFNFQAKGELGFPGDEINDLLLNGKISAGINLGEASGLEALNNVRPTIGYVFGDQYNSDSQEYEWDRSATIGVEWITGF